ncbi:MAG: tyrosine-type recombinase/integrase [Desulfobaccales bacterium]
MTTFLKFKAESSRKVYKSEISKFFSFYRGDILSLAHDHLLAYHKEISQNHSPKSVMRMFSMLKQFFLFLEKKQSRFKSPISADYGAMNIYRTCGYVESDSFKHHMETFQESLQAPNTKRSYSAQIRLFFTWVGKDLKELVQEDFVKYRDHLVGEKGLKETSVWLKFVAINRFFKFLASGDRRFKNPMDFRMLNLLFPKKDKGYYTVLTLEEQKKLLMQPDRRTPIGKRDYAILRMMLTYGLRAGEVAKLAMGNLEREKVEGKQRVWIRDRKGRHRNRVDTAIILEGKVLEALEDWLKVARARVTISDSSPMFLAFVYDVVSQSLVIDRRRIHKSLTVRQLENVVTRNVKKAKLVRKSEVISSHALRHTAFTTYAKAGRSLLEIKELAGHQDPKTTMIYVHSVQSFDNHIAMHSPIN